MKVPLSWWTVADILGLGEPDLEPMVIETPRRRSSLRGRPIPKRIPRGQDADG